MSLYAREVEDTAETLRSVVEERERLREQRDALVAACVDVPHVLRWYAGQAGAAGMLQSQQDTEALSRKVADALAHIRAEGPEPGPTRAELAEYLEYFVNWSPGGDGDAECRFCGGIKRPDEDNWSTEQRFLHWPECTWLDARSLLARMGRTVGG